MKNVPPKYIMLFFKLLIALTLLRLSCEKFCTGAKGSQGRLRNAFCCSNPRLHKLLSKDRTDPRGGKMQESQASRLAGDSCGLELSADRQVVQAAAMENRQMCKCHR